MLAPLAAVADSKREGTWEGGAPPEGKGAAGIDTYFRATPGPGSDVITVHLRFEGAVTDDAKVSLNTLDGALIEPASQGAKWRLPPKVASEVVLTIKAPPGTSYLNLVTEQGHRSGARAFALRNPPRS